VKLNDRFVQIRSKMGSGFLAFLMLMVCGVSSLDYKVSADLTVSEVPQESNSEVSDFFHELSKFVAIPAGLVTLGSLLLFSSIGVTVTGGLLLNFAMSSPFFLVSSCALIYNLANYFIK
jgi:hypothetical protein